MEFQEFKKIPRLSREISITEKIDGTNAQVFIATIEMLREELSTNSLNSWFEQYTLAKIEKNERNYYVFAGSKKRWLDITSKGDNYGFAKWVQANAKELLNLGEGRHYGEWYGKGIQRGYGLDEKRFALFNVGRWNEENKSKCCEVVPILYQGPFDTDMIYSILKSLEVFGSKIAPHFMNPEGVIIYHTASGQLFKKTILNDEKPKGQE